MRSAFEVDWEDPTDADRTWILSPWWRQPIPLLERDYMRAYGRAAAHCFAETGAAIVQFHHLQFVEGYHYMASDPIDGDELLARQESDRRRVERCEERGTSLYEAELRPEIESLLAELRRQRPRRRELAPLVEHLNRTIDTSAHVMGDLHWRGMAAPRGDFAPVYAEATGDQPSDSAVLLQAIGHKTARLVSRLRALARIVQSHPALAEALGASRYEQIDEFPRFRDGLRRFLREYGRRTGHGYGSVASFTTPTWSMRPSSVVDLVAAYARQDLDALERAEKEARAQRVRALRRARRVLATAPERRSRFETAYRRALAHARDMENSNHLIEQETLGTMREAIDAVGSHLAGRGLLDDPDLVFHLSLSLLRGAAPEDLRDLAAEHKAELEHQATLTPPRSLGSDGPGEEGPPSVLAEEELPPPDGLLRGLPASPGRATGRARVVSPSPDLPDVEPGDILVARDCGPAWTPVLPLLSGLVLDHGMADQHAAIVAREFRLPAVLGTKRATRLVSEGQTLTIDGDEGTVAL